MQIIPAASPGHGNVRPNLLRIRPGVLCGGSKPRNMTAVFVGNLEPEVLQQHLVTYWGGLSGAKNPETFVDIEANRVSGVHKEVIRAGREDKARVELTFHGAFQKNRTTDFIRNQFVQALRKKLRLSLREENSGTYGVSVSSSSYWVPKEQYTLSIRFTCESARVDELRIFCSTRTSRHHRHLSTLTK